MPRMPLSPASAPDCLLTFPQPAATDTAASWPRRMSRALRSLAVLSVLAAPALMAIGCGSESPPRTTSPTSQRRRPAGVQYRMLTTRPRARDRALSVLRRSARGPEHQPRPRQVHPGQSSRALVHDPVQADPDAGHPQKTRDTSTIMDCPEGATGDWEISNVIAGAQTFDGGSMVNFPRHRRQGARRHRAAHERPLPQRQRQVADRRGTPQRSTPSRRAR